MAPKKRALGQGLQALFQTSAINEAEQEKQEVSNAEQVEQAEKKSKASSKISSKASSKTGNKGNSKEKNTNKPATVKKAGVKEKTIAKEKPVAAKETVDKAAKQEISVVETAGEQVVMVKLSDVEPNRQQPRKHFDAEALEELADSLHRFGMIQPILVKKKEDYFEIIAGERRWRAAKIAGLREIPVLVRDYQAQEEMEVSLIENLQRKNLNPIEEAAAFQRLLTEFSLTQEEVADRMSISRSAITNSLRLLKLDERVREMVEEGKISAGHARTILMIEEKERQYQLALDILTHGYSVRDIERIVKNMREAAQTKKEGVKKIQIDDALRLSYEHEVERLKEYLGSKVALKMQDEKRGKIEISYHSMDEFERIMERISPKMGGSL